MGENPEPNRPRQQLNWQVRQLVAAPEKHQSAKEDLIDTSAFGALGHHAPAGRPSYLEH